MQNPSPSIFPFTHFVRRLSLRGEVDLSRKQSTISSLLARAASCTALPTCTSRIAWGRVFSARSVARAFASWSGSYTRISNLLRMDRISSRTARASGTLDSVLLALFLARAVHSALLAAGAGGFLGADTLAGAAAAGCWFNHFDGG